MTGVLGHPKTKIKQVRYIGPLSRLEKIDAEQEYDYTILLSGPEPQRSLLEELYAICPEEGDLDKPKLVLFIDEAHLIFQEASDALLQQLETVIKLIRSKGIGIFFCTQKPQDVPPSILSQLGLKVQHALRAFTAADRKTIKQAAENFPESEFYDIDELLTQLGIGEALVTLLNEKGIPTPLVHTLLNPPQSRMDIL